MYPFFFKGKFGWPISLKDRFGKAFVKKFGLRVHKPCEIT